MANFRDKRIPKISDTNKANVFSKIQDVYLNNEPTNDITITVTIIITIVINQDFRQYFYAFSQLIRH